MKKIEQSDLLNSEKNREVQAVIMFADIIDSSKYAKFGGLRRYNRMVREFHKTAQETIDTYSSIKIEDEQLEKRAYGDEISIFFYSNNVPTDLNHALHCAVQLRNKWLESSFNQQVLEETDHRVELRIGIGLGKVRLERSIWGQGVTAEGFPIAQAKRIEGRASEIATKSKILLQATLIEPLKNINSGLKIGEPITIDVKGIGEIIVVPVEDYQELQRKYISELNAYSKEISPEDQSYLDYTAGSFEPNNPYHLFFKGNELFHQNMLDEAVAFYRRALELQPDFVRGYNNLGMALRRQGKFEEAIDQYRTAIRIKPGYGFGFVNLGVALKQLGRLDDAIQAYHRAIEINPNDPDGYNNLCAAYRRKGMFEHAVDQYKRAIDLNPDQNLFYSNLGEAYALQGKWLKTIDACRKSIELDTFNDEAHYYLGLAYENSDQKNGAIEEYKKAIEVNPEYTEARDRLAELQ